MAGLPDNSIGVPSSAGLVPGVDIPLPTALTYNLSHGQQQREGQQASASVEPGAPGSEETLAALQQLSNLVAQSSQSTSTQVAVDQHEGYPQGDQDEAYTEQEFVGDELTQDPEALRFTFSPAEPVRKKKPKEEPTFYRDQDRFLPIANVGRLMKMDIPQAGKISKDAKECMQECASELLSFITSEAAERCLKEKRKTVTGEDILFAMATLGFDNYIEPLKNFLTKYKEHIRGEKLQEETGIPLSTPFTNDSIQQLAQLAQVSGTFQGFPGLQ